MIFDLYSEAKIQFLKELSKHSQIVWKVVEALDLDVDTGNYEEAELVGIVAAHFNIAMDGVYSRHDLDYLYDMLVEKMRGRRIIKVDTRVLH